MDEQKVNISKFMSGLLRHFPEEYDLNYTGNGWFCLTEVIDCINNEKNTNMTLEDIQSIINESSKNRYEIDIDKNIIRASYGHSIDITMEPYNTNDIPTHLYHGTAQSNLNSIMDSGLIPQNRNKVHLTDSKSEAKKVAKRHSKVIKIFKINTEELISDGFEIANPNNDSVYTVSNVPSKYLTIL